MKRFFIILGICFASIVVFFAGYLGIKYLIGDFNPEIILPENIVFEKSEYFLEEGQDITMLISTTTENITETEVSLILSKNCKETADKKHWSDGVIIIPKIAQIGEPFSVALVKDDTYASELEDDTALTNWIKGGISTIIATSKNELISPATTTAYVDVPVYKTEVVIYNGSDADMSINTFAEIEYSDFATSAQNLDAISNINAGEKFYIGLKYYPSASAVKYSKVKSTNILVEYKTQILQKLESLNLISLYNEFEDVLTSENSEFGEIIDAYTALVSRSGSAELNKYLENLIENYYKNLKYFNITEKNISNDAKAVLNGRVFGTNIYEFTASQNLGALEFYSYTFKKAGNEDLAFKLLEDGEDVLIMLETQEESGNVLKNLATLNIVDVEVDTMEINGDIPNFSENKVVTIYANKAGVNNESEAYLNITLSNSNITDVNLQNRVKNVGIRFEVKQGVNWVDASEIIKIKNAADYNTITYDGNIYYLPYGQANYWEIYANEYSDGIFRIIVKYFAKTDDELEPYICTAQIAENSLPQFNMITKTENLVSWLNTDTEELKVINLEGVLDANALPTTLIINQEYNLANNVNREALNQNTYTTVKYFIYTDDNTTKLSEYFETENTDAIEYIFNDGSVKRLYELSSSTLKLRDYTKIPNVSVKAIFVTVKTDINGTPIKNGEKYEIVKYSAVKDNLLEKLSAKEFVFKTSLKTLSGEITINDIDNAGIIEGKLFVAQSAENILSVSITCDEEEKFEEAINNNEISLVAKKGVGTPDNYITFGNGLLTAKKMTYEIATESVTEDTEVSMYIVYTIAGTNYLFPVTYKYIDDSSKEEVTLNKFTIIYNVNSTARFVILTDAGDEIDLDLVDYVKVTTEISAEDKITQVYTLCFTDGTEPLKITDAQLFENNILRVVVTNFLNKVGDDTWYITSDNALVLSVSTDNKKTINFVGNGEAIVSLFIDGNLNIQDQLKFNVQNDGYVSQYATYDNDGNEVYTFNNSDPYESKTIVLNVNGNGGIITLQDTTQIYIEDNTSLFAMWYNLGEGDDKKLTFKVKLADEDSKNVYNSIVVNAQKINDDNLYLSSSFTLGKTLGQTVVLHLIYECNELSNITQKITLNILWSTSVSSFKVYAGADEIAETATATYTLYAGYGYKFETQISNGRTPYYYVLNASSEIEEITGASSIVKRVGSLFYFDDVDGQKQYQIYISDVSTGIAIGDLQHIIKFTINSNIKAVEDVANAGYRLGVSLNENGTTTISLNDLFERKFGTKEFDVSGYRIVKTETAITLNSGNLSIYYGGMSSITNSVTASVTVSYFGYALNTITLIITPYNYESIDASRIAKANGEKVIVLCVGDTVVDNMPSIIDSELNGNKLIDNESAFSEYVASGKITAPANSLFVDTGCNLVVKDNVGNATKYKVIVSQLAYPFVNLEFTKSYTAKDLDIYKMFVTLGKEDLKAYYQEMGITIGEDIFGGQEVTLSKLVVSDNSVYNFMSNSNISFNMSLVEDGDVADFASIEENILKTGVVGREYISLHVVLKYKNGSYTYNIPTIIKVKQSQLLEVLYPYDSRTLPIDYGTDEYDEANMLAQTSAFGNAVMEYATFTSGVASVELEDNKFKVYKYDGAAYILDGEYSSGYDFEIAKVYVKLGAEWSLISAENISQYASILGNVVTINRSGAISIRVKVKVSTKEGGAVNYYYIQAGEIQDLRLYKHNGTTETGVNYRDTITVNTGDVIAISSTSNGVAYKYYTKQYENYLQFKVVGDDSIFEINQADKTITILRTPNAQTIEIKVFTLYGEIASIVVNINAYYTATLKDVDIYSGTILSITDFVKIENSFGIEITPVVVLDNDNLQDTNYDVVLDGTNKVRFAHSKTDYVINAFELLVEVEGYTFVIELKDVPVLANISAILAETEIKRLDPQAESNGMVEVAKEVWEQLFEFNDLSKAYNVSYQIIYNGGVIDTTKDSDENVAVGVLTGISDIDLEFRVVLTNIDGKLIILKANAKMEVKPQYVATINYPQGTNSNFDREYIQVGSVVDLKEENFNGVSRIILKETATGQEKTNFTLQLKTQSGNNASGLTGSVLEIEEMGVYVVEILYNGKVYGRYTVEVIGESPIGIDTTAVDGQTFYAGYGAFDLFNYVDVVLDVPTNMGSIKTEETFNIVAKVGETYVVLATNVYYNSSETERTYRIAIPLETYILGVTPNNIYVQYETDDSTFLGECKNVSISKRISATYYGSEIDSASIINVLSISGATITNIENNRYSYSLEHKADIIANKNSEEGKIKGEFFIETDFTITLEEQDDVNLTMNANEYPDGISFVETFGVRDLLGKKFWYNHIGRLGDGEAVFSLTYKNASEDSSRSILLEAETYQKDGTHYTYDYMLKAMGAKNAGTIVTLVLTYKVGSVVASFEIKIKVISDIVYTVLNNDGYATPNSETNPLVLSSVGNFKLINATQTDANNDEYYIWAYSKYNTNRKNIAQTLNYTITGATGYAGFNPSGSDRIFAFGTSPQFGDKNVVITFTDDYGFTFAYHITLVASVRIENVTLTQESFYEGGSISIYNKNDGFTYDGKGVVLDLRDEEGDQDSSQVIIKNVKIKSPTTIAESDIILSYLDATQINLKNPQPEFWTNGNGASVVITLVITIKAKDGGAETCDIVRSFVILKKYELSVKEENTYVRDGVGFNMEHLVSVYDYERNTYLGEPTIRTADAIKLDVALDKNYSATHTFAYEQDSNKANITLNGLNITDLMLARKSGDYSSVEGSIAIVTTSGSVSLDNDVANAILEIFGIKYSSGTFTLDINVVAVNKQSGESAVGVFAITLKQAEDSADDTIFVATDEGNFLYIGEAKSIFDNPSVNVSDYYFTFLDVSDEANYFAYTNNTPTDSQPSITSGLVKPREDATIATIAEFKTVYVLSVAVQYDSYLLLKTNSGLKYYQVTTADVNFNLESAEFIDTIVELYTGAYTKSGSTYSVTASGATPTGYAFNGFTLENVRLAKNISLVKIDESTDGAECTLNLEEDKLLSEFSGIKYQAIKTNLTLKYRSTSITYTKDVNVRVTLKYTGVDTESAYVGSAQIKKLEFALSAGGIKTGENGSYLVDGNKVITLDEWVTGFELVPGIGNTAKIAKFKEQDFSLNGNSDMLEFVLVAVSGAEGIVENNLVRMGADGTITLQSDFNLSEYFITIAIRCKYPNNGTLTKSEEIAKVYLGFKVV